VDNAPYNGTSTFIQKSTVPIGAMYNEYPTLEYAERLLMNRPLNLLGNLVDTPVHSQLQRMPDNVFSVTPSVFPINAYIMANVAHYSIGQGDFQLTALQNALTSSTVLNNGEMYFPSIVRSVEFKGDRQEKGEIISPDPVKGKIRVYSASVAEEIKEAMRQVVLRRTAGGVFGELKTDREFFAKTGTAETGVYKDNSIFTGFVKFRDGSHTVFSVIVPRAGLGARIAGKLTASIIGKIIEYENKKGKKL